MNLNGSNRRRADFGNWIRLHIVAAFLLSGLSLIVGSLLFDISLVRVPLFAMGLLAVVMAVFLAWLYYQFSDSGGGMQRNLWNLTLAHLDWQGGGRALDVGTGNGALAVMLGERFPEAKVVGLDPWGASWEYSQAHCQANADCYGVSHRTEFLKGSAGHLPFESDLFDAVVSHFVFHEVGETESKLEVLKEALRVVKPGGAFSFHDMFFEPRFYGPVDDFVRSLEALELAEVNLVDSRKRVHVPLFMRGRRVLGRCGIVCGRK